MKKITSLLLVVLLVVLNFTGCKNNKNKYTDYSFDYFDTVTTIVGFEKTEEEFNKNCTRIKEQLATYHKLYNIYNTYENTRNICNINQLVSDKHSTIYVDQKIIDLLLFSKDMYTLTHGKVNIAMGSVLSIWHQYREEGLNNPDSAKIPPIEVLKNLNKHTNIDDVVINTENNSVLLLDVDLKLDVGAVAKGYAAEQTAAWMQKQGFNGYLLNIGGNVKTVGKRPDGKKWKVGIENPNTDDTENPYIEYLELDDMSLVTSGSYQRFYTVKGINYHHIIDPNTLMPSDYFLSVSVVCKDSAKADALSTALFSMTYEEGAKLVKDIDDAEVMWVYKDGKKSYSEGFKNYCYK